MAGRSIRRTIGILALGTLVAVVEWAVIVLRPAKPALALQVVEGVDRSYRGRFAGELAFQTVLAQMPEQRRRALAFVERRTGLRLVATDRERILIRFTEDAGPEQTLAVTETRSVNGRRCQVVTFYLPPLLREQLPVEPTLRHELAHAVMRQRMGFRYGYVPVWLREGIAVWTAEQIEDKAALLIPARLAAGQDPLMLLNGLDTLPHTLDDLLEDALLFQYLEQRCGAPCVQRVIQDVVHGRSPRRLIEHATGLSWREVNAQVRAFSLDYIRARSTMGAQHSQVSDTFPALKGV